MNKTFVLIPICLLLSAGLALAQEAAESDQDIYKDLLTNIDSSVHAIRLGNASGASAKLQQAFDKYSDLKKIHENKFKNNPELQDWDNEIIQTFTSVQRSPTEGGIFSLRANVSSMAGRLGVSLPFIYERAMFVILLLAVLFSFFITLITKYVVDWTKVKQARAEMNAWRKEMLDAQRKKDLKRLYKLKQEQKRIMSLQSQVMMSSFKPAIFYIVPYFIFWRLLSGIYGGWVVAWLPFSITLPIAGTLVSFGFLGWFLISYFGFSSIWRKLLIGD
jgi:uncharacterized membrane protein (DUF106 family)